MITYKETKDHPFSKREEETQNTHTHNKAFQASERALLMYQTHTNPTARTKDGNYIPHSRWKLGVSQLHNLRGFRSTRRRGAKKKKKKKRKNLDILDLQCGAMVI